MNIDLFEAIQGYLQVSIVLVCLFIGYIIKRCVSSERVHKFIPLFMGIIGVVAAIWIDIATGAGFNLDTIVTGLASGLASTGLYELFHQLITKLPSLEEVEIEDELDEGGDNLEYNGRHMAK